jgi:hypothetical protein
MKSDILVSLIKEVVKNEVKAQVKEEVAKLIKSGAVTLNTQRKSVAPTLKEAIQSVDPFVAANSALQQSRKVTQPQQRTQQPKKEFTKDPMINEILNMTTPFSAEQRKEGAHAVGSVLDMIKPELRVDESEWETMDFRDVTVPQNTPQFESTGDGLQDATIKALTRDYSELVKRFK